MAINSEITITVKVGDIGRQDDYLVLYHTFTWTCEHVEGNERTDIPMERRVRKSDLYPG